MNYKEFIESCRGKKLKGNKYQIHHIVPKCLGGTDDKDNLIKLSWEDHWIAHQLLAQENPENKHLQRIASTTLKGWISKCESVSSTVNRRKSSYTLRDIVLSASSDIVADGLKNIDKTQFIIWDNNERRYVVVFTYGDYLYNTCPKICNDLWDRFVYKNESYEYNGLKNYTIYLINENHDESSAKFSR